MQISCIHMQETKVMKHAAIKHKAHSSSNTSPSMFDGLVFESAPIIAAICMNINVHMYVVICIQF